MTKRPSLFAAKAEPKPTTQHDTPEESVAFLPEPKPLNARPPSRAGKRVLSVYLDPIAWKQLRQLALDGSTSTQALGEEAINLLFEKHRLNRSA